jgi:hypothetical protein
MPTSVPYRRMDEVDALSVADVAIHDGSLRMTWTHRAPRPPTRWGRTPATPMTLALGTTPAVTPRPMSPRQIRWETDSTNKMDALAVLPPLARDGTVDQEATRRRRPAPLDRSPPGPADRSEGTRARVRRPNGHECPRDVAPARPSDSAAATTVPCVTPSARVRNGAHPALTPTISGPKPVDHLRSLRAYPAARPVGGATPCTPALAAEPRRRVRDAAKPKLRDIQPVALGIG